LALTLAIMFMTWQSDKLPLKLEGIWFEELKFKLGQGLSRGI